MTFKLSYSTYARRDLRGIYQYIASEFANPEVATKQIQRIREKIKSLKMFPRRYPLYDAVPWRGKGFRIFPVDRYQVFYVPDKDTAVIKVMRIIHSSRDIPTLLEESQDA